MVTEKKQLKIKIFTENQNIKNPKTWGSGKDAEDCLRNAKMLILAFLILYFQQIKQRTLLAWDSVWVTILKTIG